MGAHLSCLALTRQSSGGCGASGSSIATLSPVHCLRRKSSSSSSSSQAAPSCVPPLQELCALAAARAAARGAVAPSELLAVLPYDLLQCIIDALVATGEPQGRRVVLSCWM
jgi:hypothetical protein